MRNLIHRLTQLVAISPKEGDLHREDARRAAMRIVSEWSAGASATILIRNETRGMSPEQCALVLEEVKHLLVGSKLAAGRAFK